MAVLYSQLFGQHSHYPKVKEMRGKNVFFSLADYVPLLHIDPV